MEILASARRIEEFGIEFYRRFSECAREEKGAALLRGLARDEKAHLQHVEDEMRRIAPGTEPSSVCPNGSVLGIDPAAAFPFPPERCLTVDDEVVAMETGIKVEIEELGTDPMSNKIAVEFNAKSPSLDVTRIEEGHRDLLNKNLQLLKDEGAWYGYTPILEG